ncbi:hypothetical protein B0T16DRAFT_386475 [Cercophora newfieldiana]|uniref:Uncharacterized protein n=1 Tax=Cercophora newfieldiana TaxID=92897 RepID=A0AA39YSZ0_9PEZI|nr:hypothetical protein B0T16DRAFT_386475 [Cercophora newfieldiana]
MSMTLPWHFRALWLVALCVLAVPGWGATVQPRQRGIIRCNCSTSKPEKDAKVKGLCDLADGTRKAMYGDGVWALCLTTDKQKATSVFTDDNCVANFGSGYKADCQANGKIPGGANKPSMVPTYHGCPVEADSCCDAISKLNATGMFDISGEECCAFVQKFCRMVPLKD